MKIRRLIPASLLAVLALSLHSPISAHAQTVSTLFSFTGNSTGYFPYAPLLFDRTGAIYSTTTLGGASLFGTVFKLTPPAAGGNWTESILATFAGGFDGQQPNDILFGPDGVIFGSTYLGGSVNCYQGCGTVFQLTPTTSGTYARTLVYEFLGGEDGANPGNLKLGSQGVLYGPTPSGGAPFGRCKDAGCGTVFSLTDNSGTWTKTILHSFPSSTTDGIAPNADIVVDSSGNIYGTTYEGGSDNFGIVFELSPPTQSGGAWMETTLHSFTGTTDGGYPIGGLTLGENGAIFGTASYSGVPNDSGTLFELIPPSASGGSWTYSVLHSFTGGKDGATPASTLVFDPKGNLYGTTWNGGSSACYLGCGLVFRFAPPSQDGDSWTETVVHDLPDSGQSPNASIIVYRDGALYGITEFLGTKNAGTVFTITP